MNKRKYIILISLALAILLFSLQALATGIDQKKNELKQVTGKIEASQEALSELKDKQAEVIDELQDIEQELQVKEKDLENAHKRLQSIQESIEEIKEELDEANLEIEGQQEFLNSRLRALYMNGPIGYFDFIFESQNLSDFIERLEILRRIVSFDMDILETLNQQKILIEQKKGELEEQEKEIARVKDEIQQQKNQIQRRITDRQILFSELASQKGVYERALDELERTSRDLEKTIQRLQSAETQKQYAEGKLTWPVPGYYTVSSPYGNRVHPILGYTRFHTGIDIPAPYDRGRGIRTNVVAAGAGVVIFSGDLGGYGLAVIIDHGGNISTLYAHNSSLLVSQGQTVTRGQNIAYIGSTGLSTGPHLHFEVRENGNHVSPWKYLNN